MDDQKLNLTVCKLRVLGARLALRFESVVAGRVADE